MSLILPKVEGEYRFNSDLSKSNWFGIGGCAEVLFRPSSVNDLQYFLKNKPDDLNIFVIGAGSNILISDSGLKGVVIKLGKAFNFIKLNNSILEIGASTLNYHASNFALDNNIEGLEFLIGIPGSIGGGIAMNAGAYGSDFSSILTEITALDLNGNLIKLTKEEMGFKYRSNSIKKQLIFIEGKFKAVKGTYNVIKEKMDKINRNREANQPIKSKTCGSTFKNPPNAKAWQLIDQAGCRNLRIGKASVSDKHCNFLINEGGATAKDIEQLGEEIKKRVLEKFGILLEWEIKKIE